jgi:hypothetical protein
MRRVGELEIPESNREIALHLRSIREDITNMSNRLDSLENATEQRGIKFQDRVFGGLLLPVLGGMLLFLLTKAIS